MRPDLPKYLVCHTCEVEIGEFVVEGCENLMCARCGARHCPYCAEPTWRCFHFLATTTANGWLDAPAFRLDLPGIDADDPLASWPAAQQRAVLGELAAFLPAFERYLEGAEWTAADEAALLPALLAALAAPHLAVAWNGPWLADGPATDWFVREPMVTRGGLHALRQQLDVAFRRLVSTQPWRRVI